MVNQINSAGEAPELGRLLSKPKIIPREMSTGKQSDVVELGQGRPLNGAQIQNMVLERAMAKLGEVVQAARDELGIPTDAVLDTSPDATANRIADFALGFFSKYAENNGLQNDEAGRAQYADFIGGAISQGIDEARGILGSLQALNADVTAGIDQTAEIVKTRLADFVTNGFSK
jgi:hypothetical protein